MALYTLLAKCSSSEANQSESESSTTEVGLTISESSVPKGKNLIDSHGKHLMQSELEQMGRQYNAGGDKSPYNVMVELADCVADFHSDVPYSKLVPAQQPTCSQAMVDSRYSTRTEQPATNPTRASCLFVDTRNGIELNRTGGSDVAMEGPSGESTCYQLNNNAWLSRDQSSDCSSTSAAISNDWGRCSMPPLWGGRVVGRRQVKSATGSWSIQGEEYDAFINIFEGGSLLYCNMSFEALLNVRKQLEELGFPCKAVNDGLWLQVSNHHDYISILELKRRDF